MDSPSTPPSRRSKVSSRLLHRFPSSPADAAAAHSLSRTNSPPPFSPSPLHLLLSSSPLCNPKPPSPLPDDILLAPPPAAAAARRKTKARAPPAAGLIGCGSPKNARRARRRLEKEVAREDATALDDDAPRPRKRRQSKPRASHREKLAAIPSPVPSSTTLLPCPVVINDDDGALNSLDGLWEAISELVMWKNVAKSTLWFGFGSIFFTSSWLSKDFSFSIISAAAHLGVLISAIAFFYDSFSERQQKRRRRDFRLTEEDVLCAARVVLPTVNAALSKSREIFSGEPRTTLKVAPILLFAAKYGHLLTLWRLLATGFFMSFTIPKLYSCYSQQIHSGVGNVRRHISETWNSCGHKRIVAASAATAFWNLFNVKTRIFAAFFVLVILRYHHQQHRVKEENVEIERSEEEEQQQAMVLAD